MTTSPALRLIGGWPDRRRIVESAMTERQRGHWVLNAGTAVAASSGCLTMLCTVTFGWAEREPWFYALMIFVFSANAVHAVKTAQRITATAA